MQIYQKVNMNYCNIRKGYAGFLNEWDWEVFCTLSFNRYVDFNTASKQVKRWLRGKGMRTRLSNIKFACVLILSNPHNETPHVHMLMISDPRYPRRLTDISNRLFKFIVFSWDHGSCKMEKVWDGEGISNYTARMKNITLWDPDRWEFQFFRPRLFGRLRRCPRVKQFQIHFKN